jgi:hypothetical protein
MENKERIQRLYDIHREGASGMLEAYATAQRGEQQEETLVSLEESLSQELGVVKKSLNIISEALHEISEDLVREAFYLEELRNSEDPDYQSFISHEYGFLLSRLLDSHRRIEENYQMLAGKKEVWKRLLERLGSLSEAYPAIDRMIQKQWEILEEI